MKPRLVTELQSSFLTHSHCIWGHREVGATAPASEVKLLRELFVRHIQDEQKRRGRAIRTLRVSLKFSPVFRSFFLLERDRIIVCNLFPPIIGINLPFIYQFQKIVLFLSFLFFIPFPFTFPVYLVTLFPFETDSSVAQTALELAMQLKLTLNSSSFSVNRLQVCVPATILFSYCKFACIYFPLLSKKSFLNMLLC